MAIELVLISIHVFAILDFMIMCLNPTCLSKNNLYNLQELLSFNHVHVYNPRLRIANPEAQCERWFEQPWDEVVAAHLK